MCFLYSLNTNRIRGVLNVQGAYAIFFETLKCARINDTSRVIRNPNILHMRKQSRRCCNRAADQRLCFCYIDTVFPLLPKSEISASSDLLWLGSTARFVSDLVGYHRIQVLAEIFFPRDMFFFCTVTTFCLIRKKHIQQNNASLLNTHPYISRIARNPVFGVYNPARHKLCCTATEDA